MTDLNERIHAWTFECSVAYLASIVTPDRWRDVARCAREGVGLVSVPGYLLDGYYCSKLLAYRKEIFDSLNNTDKKVLQDKSFNQATFDKFKKLGLIELGRWTNFGMAIMLEAEKTSMPKVSR